MKLADEQYEDIKKAIIDTFIEYGVRCVPINAFEMACKMGIKMVPYSALTEIQRRGAIKRSADGFSIEKNDYQWIIYYNDSCNSYGRVNQTIMHEIGHYVLGHIDEGDEEESEAKFFAKYALAPPPLVHCMKVEKTPENIMDVFDISYEAAINAYKYYQSWMKYGEKEYTKYELQLLELFRAA